MWREKPMVKLLMDCLATMRLKCACLSLDCTQKSFFWLYWALASAVQDRHTVLSIKALLHMSPNKRNDHNFQKKQTWLFSTTCSNSSNFSLNLILLLKDLSTRIRLLPDCIMIWTKESPYLFKSQIAVGNVRYICVSLSTTLPLV